jgi:spore maturation protein CgeB
MKKNNILLVGAFSPNPSIYTYASSFYNALQQLGYNVTPYNYRYNLFSWNNYLNNQYLITTVQKAKPDLIFLIKAETITAKTLDYIKKTYGSTIVNFYPDNPFVLWNGNSNAEVLKSLPLYDCFLSWSKILIPALQSTGCKQVYYFPFAYDEELFVEQITITEQDEAKYTADICFIGTWEPMREQWLSQLVQRLPSLSLAIYGNQWNTKCIDTVLKKSIRGPAVYKQEMIKAFRLSKIVLNFIRQQNTTSHNMRTFEVPASKAFLLTERTTEQAQELFIENENIACFSTPDELIRKIEYYLNNEQERQRILINSYKRSKDFTLKKHLASYLKTNLLLS